MPKQLRLPIIATAATKEVLEHPTFPKVLKHWSEIGSRIIVIVPRGTPTPQIRKIRYIQVNSDVPTLGDVIHNVNEALDYVLNKACVVDPFTVFKYNVFRMFEIAERRSLSLAWMATAHPVKLVTYDEPIGIDETQLSFFCAGESIWSFIENRELPDHVPFISPAWSGWLGHWATLHVHTHKYHDLTDLRAIGMFEDIPSEEVSMDGLGPLTFNPPIRNYVNRG